MKVRRLPPPPDLQELVARYGSGLSAVPVDELIKHERAFEEWRAKMRAGELQISDDDAS